MLIGLAGSMDFELPADPSKAARNELMSSLNRGEDVTKGELLRNERNEKICFAK